MRIMRGKSILIAIILKSRRKTEQHICKSCLCYVFIINWCHVHLIVLVIFQELCSCMQLIQ
jgi:hypothetical protein